VTLPELRLGTDDAGRTIEVAAGDRLELRLPEIAGTGYTWTVDDLPPGAQVVEERYDHRPAGAIGGSAEHVFVISAPEAPGEVKLRHARPWEGAGGELERFAVTVVPADGGGDSG
jgi:predicted secreted protein